MTFRACSRVPWRRGFEIFKGACPPGPIAHLRRSVEGQQDHQRHRRPEMDPERRRLLERVQQEAEGRLGLTRGGGGMAGLGFLPLPAGERDRKSTRLNSSHGYISYAVFCLKK